MVSKKQPDCTPPGWKVQTKVKNGRKYKYYINARTHQKFYSRVSMLRYIKEGCISNEKVQHKNEHTKKTSGKKQMQLVQANDYEWLPTGWIVERRFRKSGARVGTEYKCFIDPSSGSKFFSKPEVLRYLRSKQHSAVLSRRKDKERSGHSSSGRSVDSPNADKSNLEAKVSQISKTRVCNSVSSGKRKIVVEKTVDEELPSGWIKETRIKMLGNRTVRRDPFFVDPASRLVFRSKLEVLRYVETGEISRHAYRRRDENISGEDLAITISSGRKQDTAKSRTRKQLFEGEGTSGGSIEAPPKAHKKSGGQNSKTSFRVRPALADASSSKKSSLSPESASDSQEKAEVKKPLGVGKHTLPAVQDVDVKEASLGKSEPSSVSSRDVFPEKPLAAVHDCNDKKVPITKRKTKDGKTPCVPLRSSKRLAGVDTEVVFLPIPIEHALRPTNRKPSRTRHVPSIPSLGSVPNEKQEKHEDVDGKDLNECAAKGTDRRKSSSNKPSSCLNLVQKELLDKCQDADTNNEEVLQATGRRKSVRSELLPCSEAAPDELHEKRQDVDNEILLATQGEPPLKRIDDSNFQESNHKTIDGDGKIVLDLQVDQPLNKIDSNFTSLEEQRQRHDQENSETVPASQGEPFYKIDDLPFQDVMHHHKLDVDAKTVIATQGEPSNKIDDIETKRPILVDLNELQLEAPPGFSESAKVEAPTVTMKQSLEHRVGTFLGSKVENTSKERPTLEEKSGEKLASTEKQTEQPQPELCFTAPLWSDPCLEFAYKTLTGAIPFDDNLAIQDYIQHQLRTSKQSPDTCTPSFFRNDESKMVSQLPEDVNFLNSNNFGSQEIKQVKNK